jgi:D-alanine-D-alanine ligase
MRGLIFLRGPQVKIAVLFGGDSMERDVSVASASQVVAALRSRGHQVLAVDAHRGLLTGNDEQQVLGGKIARLPPARSSASGLPAALEQADLRDVDIVFLALHGGSGEDGTIQSVLDLAGLPYTGSGRLGSALAWDKDIAKRLFVAAAVPTPSWFMVPVAPERIAEELGFPVIVKPAGQGSTVGLTLVHSIDELAPAVALAAQFDAAVMVERYIDGRELTVGILDGVALAVGEIVPAEGPIFDYAAKYQAGAAEEIFPADLPAETSLRVQELGLKVHEALKLDDYSRVDFRMDKDGGLWCLEVNTLPGLSSGSLLPRSARASGIDFASLCERICQAALKRRR